jgi:hypothetical protein
MTLTRRAFGAILATLVLVISGCGTGMPDCDGSYVLEVFKQSDAKDVLLEAICWAKYAEYNYDSKRLTADFNADKDKATFAKKDVIIVSKDPDAKSVQCKATFSAVVPGWSAFQQVRTYTIETTSDGKRIVTFH